MSDRDNTTPLLEPVYFNKYRKIKRMVSEEDLKLLSGKHQIIDNIAVEIKSTDTHLINTEVVLLWSINTPAPISTILAVESLSEISSCILSTKRVSIGAVP